MGHVINPSAMRLGNFRYWEDLWYKEHLYYPEFLHQIFKMKLFLISFFGCSTFEHNNIFFSHFYFVYQNKSLIIKILLYLGHVEFFFNNFFLDNTLTYNLLTGKFLNIKQHFWITFLLYLKIFFKLNNKDLFKYKDLFIFLFSEKRKINKSLYLNKSLKIYLFFIYNLLKNKTFNLENLFSFWWVLVQYFSIIPKFTFIKSFIDNLINYLFKTNHIYCSIFSISNDNLNAKFLARFIAKKLQQGFSIKQVIRPIVKDLLITNQFSTIGSLDLNLKDELKNEKIKKEFKNYLKKYKYFFKHILILKFSILKTWITVDFFNFFFIIKKKLKKSTVIQVFKIYWKNINMYNFYLNYYVQNYYFLKLNYNKYFEYLFKIFNCSNKHLFEQNFPFLNTFLIKISFFFLNWFLKLQYLNFCLIDLKNKQKFVNKENLCLLGFKFHFVGRFSRKQRSSSIWFMQGIVPLNTLNANIEFGYYVIPLFNSAIRVKIFINRGKVYNEFAMKII